MTKFETNQVLFAGFSSSADAKRLGLELFGYCGFSAHHQLARLAIGRSLGETDFPPPAADARGFNIKGNLLFGDEKEGALLWIALIVENLRKFLPKKEVSLDVFQAAVRDHWSYGVSLLYKDWQASEDSFVGFVETLITQRAGLPEDGGGGAIALNSSQLHSISTSKAAPIWLTLGRIADSNQPAKWLLNGRGYSPNIAIMGQAGSGKTREMLSLLADLKRQTGVPVLLIDVGKDELADRSELAKELDAEVIRVPKSPIPLDMFQGSNESPDSALEATEAFRESLNKALQSGLTDNQKTRVLEALKPLFRQREHVQLPDLQSAIDRYYEEQGTRPDRVNSIMNELCQRTLFVPTLSPEKFFSKNWIITFGGAPEESRKLVLFLLFDALHRYLRSLPEAQTDAEFHRGLRLAVAIDEAKPLLATKHDGLSKMVRLHRSKGLTVLMASQSPDDYEGQSDDYLEQIGLPICFKTNATSTAVLNNMFKSKRGLNFSALESGVCLTVLDGNQTKVKAF